MRSNIYYVDCDEGPECDEFLQSGDSMFLPKLMYIHGWVSVGDNDFCKEHAPAGSEPKDWEVRGDG